jgi:hypothetical protein
MCGMKTENNKHFETEWVRSNWSKRTKRSPIPGMVSSEEATTAVASGVPASFVWSTFSLVNAKTGEVDWRRLVNWQQACMADLSPCDALCHASWGRPTPRVSFPRLITMLNETWYSVLLVVTSSMCVASSAGVISKCQGHADVIFSWRALGTC